jgi:exopolysaccharide production protein ExoQ
VRRRSPESGIGNAGKALGNRAAVAAVTCLFLLMGTDILLIFFGENRSLVRAVIALCSLGIVISGIVFHRTLLSAAAVDPFLTTLVALVCASVFWSVSPGNTAIRLPAFVTCTLLGMMTGRALSLRALIYFLASFGSLIALLSLAAIAAFPEARGAPPWEDTWRGIFGHKNGLGSACAMVLPFTVYAAVVAGGIRRYCYALGTIGLLVLLVASASRTAQMIACLALLNLGIALAFGRLQFSWSIITVTIFAATLASLPLIISSGLAQSLFEMVGRQPTLSGRIPLWQLVWAWIEERPVLGYGYAAFWEPDSYRMLQITRQPSMQWEVFYSHNGALETLLDVGVVGLTLLSLVYGRAFWAILSLLRRLPNIRELAPMLILIISFGLVNLTEATALQREDLVWIIFVAAAVRLRTLSLAEQADRLRFGSDHGAGRPPLPHLQAGSSAA